MADEATSGKTKFTQDPAKIAQLVHDLKNAQKNPGKKKGFACRKSTYKVSGTDDRTVDSWKFQEWDYKRQDLPTYARGLFTAERKDKTPEIVARGYDKFFNIDETTDTHWRNIEHNTRGPYELSVKENGCIIFISGLEGDKLLVCSKHSTGVRTDAQMPVGVPVLPNSHAMVGERWVEKHVATVGRTAQELARTLREMNATAVGELCDDSFEEHVLAYDADASGIYLHGLNYNLPEFATQSAAQVHKFADAWGFKKAKFVVHDDIVSVRRFLEGCAETGTWDGRETEGFVIRCQMARDQVHYRDWFFKYKFEEPYLMYRQWRECTKAVIQGKFPKIRKHEMITEEYLNFARRVINEDVEVGRAYLKNHGIIALREKFLKERGLKGSEIIAMEQENGRIITNNVVLVPIATIGCGKTTMALALQYLFGWGVVQNDGLRKAKNNQSKPKRFAFDVTQAMSKYPLVIADRNNHQRRERQQLMEDVSAVVPHATFVAMQYVHEPERLDAIRAVTRFRVHERGDNHQTIKAATRGDNETWGIMDGFIHRFEGVNLGRKPDDNFHHLISLNACNPSRHNLEYVIQELHEAYPRLVPEIPPPEALDAAIDYAIRDYHVTVDNSADYARKGPKGPQANNGGPVPQPHNDGPAPQSMDSEPIQLARKIDYFGITIPTEDVDRLLKEIFANATSDQAQMYRKLIEARRVQQSFHVTLIHRADNKKKKELWDSYVQQYIKTLTANPQHDPMHNPPILGKTHVRLERLVWDSRVMAFVVRISPGEEDMDVTCANAIPHVTVGTANPSVKPVESNDLLQRWVMRGSGGDSGIFEVPVPGEKILNGTIGVSMQRFQS
ncbi:hypothetical protein N7532_006012 [Penicillium argentinense]|uniref:tRNA ligase n=1 Tax=Penicillium argentinense TaxID=1131581 RepID=A0A9W9FF68_9EURO|nr:uncharacterized protein N7532_006012 [Penicillium argentinense]KAJ5099011.1 hypothetical protein N7532_006012 [Penicillium argentinense]